LRKASRDVAAVNFFTFILFSALLYSIGTGTNSAGLWDRLLTMLSGNHRGKRMGKVG
jgi:hypothetical protein